MPAMGESCSGASARSWTDCTACGDGGVRDEATMPGVTMRVISCAPISSLCPVPSVERLEWNPETGADLTPGHAGAGGLQDRRFDDCFCRVSYIKRRSRPNEGVMAELNPARRSDQSRHKRFVHTRKHDLGIGLGFPTDWLLFTGACLDLEQGSLSHRVRAGCLAVSSHASISTGSNRSRWPHLR